MKTKERIIESLKTTISIFGFLTLLTLYAVGGLILGSNDYFLPLILYLFVGMFFAIFIGVDLK